MAWMGGVAACASRAPMSAVGVSNGGALESHAAPSVAARVPSPIPVDFRATLTKVNRQRFNAGGHAGGRFDADVYVTPSAKDAAFGILPAPPGLGGGIPPTPPGTVLVMEEVELGKSTAGPVLMMEKEAPGFDSARGDWRYVVVDGTDVQDGALDLCASCHAEAPHDHVFAVD